MNLTNRWLLIAAAIAGASGVMIGAFGAHGLPGWLQSQGADPALIGKRLTQFETGARYHLVHAVVLVSLAVLDFHLDPRSGGAHTRLRWAAILFLAGILLFSGSLYLLVITNTPWLGAITPLGGVSWIVAWLLLAFCFPKGQTKGECGSANR